MKAVPIRGSLILLFGAAWVLSLALTLAYGHFVPKRYPLPSELQGLERQLAQKGYLTQAEFDEWNRIALKAQAESRAALKQESGSDWWLELRMRALGINWIPWALLGLLVVRTRRELLVVLIGLACLALAQPIESAVFGMAVLCGFAARLCWKGRRVAPAA